MSEELDINKMAAEFVTQNIEKFYNTGKDVLKGAADTVRLRLSRSYKDYLERVTVRYSKAKSFFIRNEPINLYDFYVPTSISIGKKKVDSPSIGTISSITHFAVITGGGGSGKSMLMRHLLMDAVMQHEKVPIFLELRELNQTRQPLLEFIKETLRSNHFTLGDEYIEKALKTGHFALLMDGFDEVAYSIQNDLRSQLFNLAKEYDRNTIVLSSRPDNEFSGWSDFSVFSMDALTLPQAVRLVMRLPFDADLKSKFLDDLEGGLFEKHKSFLSNPLLLSIMLLTYGENAEIPNKLSIFYGHAYETLFQRHDALKAGFQRERLTRLDQQDFARVFSAFSVQTFDKRLFQLAETQALDYLDRAKNIVGIDFNSRNYLRDAEQAVCLLVEEGLMISFAHRSFQEYFVARFICNSRPEVQKKLIDRYSKEVERDNVLRLLYEMQPELVERTYIIPYIEQLRQIIGVRRRVGMTHFARFIKAQYGDLSINEDGIWATVNTRYRFNRLISFTLKNCGHLIKWNGFDASQVDADTQAIWKKYGNIEVETSELSYKDELLRDVASGDGYLSIKALQLIFSIKEALIKKHLAAERSLDELLEG